MKIVIACDHAGFELKNDIIGHLNARGFDVTDLGCHSTASVDYNDYANALCTELQAGNFPLGILVCGTGVGMSMNANKHRGIRAACCSDTFTAAATRKHNDANVLCLGGRVVGKGLAFDIVDNFVDTAFEGGRHAERVARIMEVEKM